MNLKRPSAPWRARYRYGCFERTGDDPQAYGYAASFGLSESCEREVIAQLVELRRRTTELAARDGRLDPDEFFFANRVHCSRKCFRTAPWTGQVFPPLRKALRPDLPKGQNEGMAGTTGLEPFQGVFLNW